MKRSSATTRAALSRRTRFRPSSARAVGAGDDNAVPARDHLLGDVGAVLADAHGIGRIGLNEDEERALQRARTISSWIHRYVFSSPTRSGMLGSQPSRSRMSALSLFR